MQTVIFDLDGTLCDTSGDLIAAANACFRDMGYGDVLDPVADAAIAVRGGRAMLTAGFERVRPNYTEDDIDAQYPRLLQAYGDDINRFTTFYDGALAACARLRAAGVGVGICTNKPEALAEMLMMAMGARPAFDVLIGADTLPVRKPDPAPLFAAIDQIGGDRTKSVLIGDTITDHSTARAAGIPSVLVTFGPAGRTVADLEPDALLDHYDDIEAVLEPFIGAIGA